jgi:hypothetical protein
MNDPSGGSPLKEARDWLRARVYEGERCPCCTQFAKIYRRKINSGMARALIRQWQVCGQDYVRTTSLCPWTHEAGQLVWWGLIEDEGGRREDGGRSGWWRITDAGKRFVLHQDRVAKYAHIYDGRVLRLDPSETVSIVECLGAKFDYRELMEGL